MNSAKQYMNSAKQYVNSELMWGYCSRAEKKKKKKKAENVDAAKRQETRKPNTHMNYLQTKQGLTRLFLSFSDYCSDPTHSTFSSNP